MTTFDALLKLPDEVISYTLSDGRTTGQINLVALRDENKAPRKKPIASFLSQLNIGALPKPQTSLLAGAGETSL